MASLVKKSIVTLFAGASMLTVAAGPASAATQNQDGLVNVAVGDVTILQDANIGVAAQVAATVCGVKVGPVAVLGTAVDRSGFDRIVCTASNGPVRIIQN
jgi:hypothetical protein